MSNDLNTNIDSYINSDSQQKYFIEKKQVFPRMIKVDSTEDFKLRCYELAITGLEKFALEKDISEYIKERLDEEFTEEWQCIIGMDFAASLTHESRNLVFFCIEKTYFLIFKI